MSTETMKARGVDKAQEILVRAKDARSTLQDLGEAFGFERALLRDPDQHVRFAREQQRAKVLYCFGKEILEFAQHYALVVKELLTQDSESRPSEGECQIDPSEVRDTEETMKRVFHLQTINGKEQSSLEWMMKYLVSDAKKLPAKADTDAPEAIRELSEQLLGEIRLLCNVITGVLPCVPREMGSHSFTAHDSEVLLKTSYELDEEMSLFEDDQELHVAQAVLKEKIESHIGSVNTPCEENDPRFIVKRFYRGFFGGLYDGDERDIVLNASKVVMQNMEGLITDASERNYMLKVTEKIVRLKCRIALSHEHLKTETDERIERAEIDLKTIELLLRL